MRKIVIVAALLSLAMPASASAQMPPEVQSVVDAGFRAWWQCLQFEMTPAPADEMDEDRWGRAEAALVACKSIPDSMVRRLNALAPPATIDPSLFWTVFISAEGERMRALLQSPPVDGGR